MKQNLTMGFLAIIFSLTNILPALATPESVEDVVKHLVGKMDTSAQAFNKGKTTYVRMTTCRITVEETKNNSVFLYQEQGINNTLNQPYRQRFLEISAKEDGEMVESKSYKPLKPEMWVNLCDRPENERVVKMTDLGDGVCQVFLKPLVTVFIGNTPESGCPANYRGATKITNTIILHSRGMDTWDRGFDKKGNQVWGAKDQSYQFLWLK